MNFYEWLLLETFETAKSTITQLNKNLPENVVDLMATTLQDVTNNFQKYFNYLLGIYESHPHSLLEDYQIAYANCKFLIERRINVINQIPQINSITDFKEIAKNYNHQITEVRSNELSKGAKTPEQKAKAKKQLLPKDKLDIIHQDQKWTIYKVKAVDKKDEVAVEDKHRMLCYLGKGTHWCTAINTSDHHLNYAENDIYTIYKFGKPKYQFDLESNQFMDVNDNPVEVIEKSLYEVLFRVVPQISKFHFKTEGLSFIEDFVYNEKSFSDIEEKLEKVNIKDLYEFAKVVGRLPEKYEARLLESPMYAYLYSLDVIKERLPEDIEKAFLKDPHYAYYYAADILKKRFPEDIEKVFLKSAQYAYKYATDVVKDRLPEDIEKGFLESPEHAYLYARDVVKGRLPEYLEKVFLKDSYCAHKYARDVVKDRLPEDIEKVFLDDPEDAYSYAFDVIDGRLPEELEQVFLESPEYAYYYAKDIVKERLPEDIEKVFLKNPEYAFKYAKDVAKGRLPKDIEKVILKDKKYGPIYKGKFLNQI